jgi:hypothetical protein
MSLSLAAVVTTIQPPTPAVYTLVERVRAAAGHLFVAGDRKGPHSFDMPATTFLSLDDQLAMDYALPSLLPVGHYTRKNVAYLAAIEAGAQCLYETDDDNAPNEDWSLRNMTCAAELVSGARWHNVYGDFSDQLLWPRGLPLQEIRAAQERQVAPVAQVSAPVQQGLADGSPDVDAIWRLALDRDIRFDRRTSVALSPGTFCPFNSQTTWWWPVAYELLYLPSRCTFRMTDIWRSFVAQRCLWELGYPLVFHSPEVEQVRNEHDLLVDFRDEVPGYLLNARLGEALAGLDLEPGADRIGANLVRCYQELVSEGAVERQELDLVQAWLSDVAVARHRGATS